MLKTKTNQKNKPEKPNGKQPQQALSVQYSPLDRLTLLSGNTVQSETPAKPQQLLLQPFPCAGIRPCQGDSQSSI